MAWQIKKEISLGTLISLVAYLFLLIGGWFELRANMTTLQDSIRQVQRAVEYQTLRIDDLYKHTSK